MRVVRAALVLAVAVVATSPRVAHAHPFGAASVNRYLGVELGPARRAHVAYLLDFGELPAAREFERLDRDANGAVTPAEREAYLDALLPPLIARWRLDVDGEPVAPRIVARTLEVASGENGLPTLRVVAEILSDAPHAAPHRDEAIVHVRDDAYAERPGWREIRADDSDAGAFVASDLAAVVPSGERRTMRVDEATLRFRVAGAPHRAPARPTHGSNASSIALAVALALLVAIALVSAARRRRSRSARTRPDSTTR